MARALVAFGLSQVAVMQKATAAMYTVVPRGSIADKQTRLAEVEKIFAKTPDDPYVFGEKAQLEFDVKALERNRDFTRQLSRDVADGTAVFPQSLTVAVPNMDEAVRFWTLGVGAMVHSTRLDSNNANVTRIGFGPQTFSTDDGAKFSLELVEAPGIDTTKQFAPETSVVQYVQLAIPIFRLSQVMFFGGEIESAYGWTEARAPGGLPLRVSIDESRRDPFEFVALRTSDVKQAQTFYESLGMKKIGEKSGKRSVTLGEGSYGFKINSDSATYPDREPGTIQMTYGDPDLTTGLLLLPPKKRGNKLTAGTPPAAIQLVGRAPSSAVSGDASFDGLRSSFVALGPFEKSVAQVAVAAPKAAPKVAPFQQGKNEGPRTELK